MFLAQAQILLQSSHRAGFQGHITRLTSLGFSNQQRSCVGVEIVRLQMQSFGDPQPCTSQQTQKCLETGWEQTLRWRQGAGGLQQTGDFLPAVDIRLAPPIGGTKHPEGGTWTLGSKDCQNFANRRAVNNRLAHHKGVAPSGKRDHAKTRSSVSGP